MHLLPKLDFPDCISPSSRYLKPHGSVDAATCISLLLRPNGIEPLQPGFSREWRLLKQHFNAHTFGMSYSAVTYGCNMVVMVSIYVSACSVLHVCDKS